MPLRKKDCCGCSDWKQMLKELWEKYQGTVRGIKVGNVTVYPDGNGTAILPELDLDTGVGLIDLSSYWVMITTPGGNATLTNKTTYYQLDVI